MGAIEVIKEYADLPLVGCYAGELNQVFMNIIVNAIDAFEDDQFQRQEAGLPEQSYIITIRTHLIEPDHVTIVIMDNGPGMTEQTKKRLFDPFFTTKPVGKGTGLGLSITYQIVVEKHGGKLECISEPGRGTQFWITIPIRQK
jgi:signal transduction histidine kinase